MGKRGRLGGVGDGGESGGGRLREENQKKAAARSRVGRLATKMAGPKARVGVPATKVGASARSLRNHSPNLCAPERASASTRPKSKRDPPPPAPAAQSGRTTPEPPSTPTALAGSPPSLRPPRPFRLRHPAAAPPPQPFRSRRPSAGHPPQPDRANPTGASFPTKPIWLRRSRASLPSFPDQTCRSQPPQSPTLPPTRRPRAAVAARPQDSHGAVVASWGSSIRLRRKTGVWKPFFPLSRLNGKRIAHGYSGLFERPILIGITLVFLGEQSFHNLPMDSECWATYDRRRLQINDD